jgi:protocatechuate 3,4-dioxygenase alpha subunit
MSRESGADRDVLVPTPGQTVGPFFHYALPFPGDRELVPPGSPGSVRLSGVVRDGAGAPVADALVELWQADAEGRVVQRTGSLRRDGHVFTGWGRASTDRTGRYTFTTVRPGASEPGTAPFFALTVFARGLLDRLLTRAYLPSADLEHDRFLAGLDPARRSTVVATEDEHGFAFDIRLQGEGETVFLAHGGR